MYFHHQVPRYLRFIRLPWFGALLCLYVMLVSTALGNASEHSPPDLSKAPIHFETLSIEQGLPQNTILSIAQDAQGFMWFGGQNGLSRFDGYQFKVYRSKPANPHSLANNWIGALYVDRESVLWIGTRNGLQKFNPSDESFTMVEPSTLPGDHAQIPDTNGRQVTFITGDNQAGLWIATKAGLQHYDKKRRAFSTFRYDAQKADSISSDKINTVTCDSNGGLWVGTDIGLDYLAPGANSFEHIAIDLGRGASRKLEVRSLLLRKQGELWVGTEHGVARLDPSSKRAIPFPHPIPSDVIGDRVYSLLEDKQGDIWIGTLSHGLLRYAHENETFRQFRHFVGDHNSLCDDEVYSLFQDHTETLWIGSWAGGTCRVDLASGGFGRYTSQEQKPQRLSNDKISAVLGDHNGLIYIPTYGGGLNLLDPKTGIIRIYRHAPKELNASARDRFSSIVIDQHDQVWLTSISGLERFDLKTGRFYLRPRLASDPKLGIVYQTLIDHAGNFWMSSNNGLAFLDYQTQKMRLYRHEARLANSLYDDSTYALLEDSKQRLWIGSPSGLQMLDLKSGQFHFYRHDPHDPNSIGPGHVSVIIEDTQNHIWIGTENGLNRISNETEEKLQFKFYAVESTVDAILEGGQQDLWLSTDAGISHFDMQSGELRHYTEQDGMTKGEFYYGAAFKSSDGRYFFGGTNGLTVFRPEHIKKNPYPPIARITGFYLGNQALNINAYSQNSKDKKNLNNAVKLPKEQNRFTIEFTALHFSNVSKNRFKYKLDNYDNEWISIDAKIRQANYANLDPGRYIFRVKAQNEAGIWSQEEATLEINVTPPYWKTNWFRVLVTTLTIGLIWYLYNLRVGTLIRQRNWLEEVVRERTQEVRQQNQNKSKFIADAAHDLRQPMQAISNLLEALRNAIARDDLQKSRSLIQLAQNATHVMRSSFNAILEVSRLESGLVKPEYSVFDLGEMIDEVITSMRPFADERQVKIRCQKKSGKHYFIQSDQNLLYRVIVNLVSNAIKYSKPDKKEAAIVVIRLVVFMKFCRLYVLDNGIGIAPSDQNNIFKAFYQVANQERDREKGLGLGLSIVSATIEMLTGHAMFMRSNLGHGTRFYLDLPRAEGLGPAPANKDNISTESSVSLTGLYVIYVEDDLLVRTSTVELLTEFEIICEAFHSYEALLDNLAYIERMPDLILTDYLLANHWTGRDVIAALRKEFSHAIPAIIITGESKHLIPDDIVQTCTILTKPVSPHTLIEEIDKLCKHPSEPPTDHKPDAPVSMGLKTNAQSNRAS